MKLAALNTLIKPLQMADEIKAAENICECRGDLWTYELQLAIVERRAAEWVINAALPQGNCGCFNAPPKAPTQPLQ